ncbi:MAG: phosphatidylserine decarboxylase family protein [Syntrophobacteria bacterium]
MQRSFIARAGLPYIGTLAVLLVVFVLLGWTYPAVLTLIATGLVTNFFRDPERAVPNAAHAILAPADGRIVFLGKVFEDRFLGKEALKISIFMSIFDVHVNRIPVCGEVAEVHYHKGKFFSANLEKASRANERNAIVVQVPGGEKILFVQIAGLIARRIECWLQPGDRVKKGERFGIIRFGSRVDLFVPPESSLTVRKGERVKAGETIVCYYQKEKKEGGTEGHGR